MCMILPQKVVKITNVYHFVAQRCCHLFYMGVGVGVLQKFSGGFCIILCRKYSSSFNGNY